jgi:nitrogen regulatory protein PII
VESKKPGGFSIIPVKIFLFHLYLFYLTTMLESPHPSLQTVKKVDIIVSHAFLEEILSVLDVVGVSGYTVFGNTSGKGDRGLSCDDLDCDYSGSYIMTVCNSDEQLDHLIDKIQPFLKKAGGIFVVTTGQWLTH